MSRAREQWIHDEIAKAEAQDAEFIRAQRPKPQREEDAENALRICKAALIGVLVGVGIFYGLGLDFKGGW